MADLECERARCRTVIDHRHLSALCEWHEPVAVEAGIGHAERQGTVVIHAWRRTEEVAQWRPNTRRRIIVPGDAECELAQYPLIPWRCGQIVRRHPYPRNGAVAKQPTDRHHRAPWHGHCDVLDRVVGAARQRPSSLRQRSIGNGECDACVTIEDAREVRQLCLWWEGCIGKMVIGAPAWSQAHLA